MTDLIPLCEWARARGINDSTARDWANKGYLQGATPPVALMIQMPGGGPGEMVTAAQFATMRGVSANWAKKMCWHGTIRHRAAKGWMVPSDADRPTPEVTAASRVKVYARVQDWWQQWGTSPVSARTWMDTYRNGGSRIAIERKYFRALRSMRKTLVPMVVEHQEVPTGGRIHLVSLLPEVTTWLARCGRQPQHRMPSEKLARPITGYGAAIRDRHAARQDEVQAVLDGAPVPPDSEILDDLRSLQPGERLDWDEIPRDVLVKYREVLNEEDRVNDGPDLVDSLGVHAGHPPDVRRAQAVEPAGRRRLTLSPRTV